MCVCASICIRNGSSPACAGSPALASARICGSSMVSSSRPRIRILAVHDRGVHRAAVGREHQVGVDVRLVARHQRGEHRVGRVHQDHVGLVPGVELAGVVPQRRGPVPGGHPDHGRGLHAGWRPPAGARCISEANFITSNASRLLLHSAASWPRPTLIPAASISGSRAIPLPSLALELGLCEIWVLRLAHQRDLGVRQPHAVRGHAVGAEQPGVVGHLGRPPAEPLLAVLHLGQRLVQVDVDAGAQLVGQGAGVAEQFGEASGSHSIPTYTSIRPPPRPCTAS